MQGRETEEEFQCLDKLERCTVRIGSLYYPSLNKQIPTPYKLLYMKNEFDFGKITNLKKQRKGYGRVLSVKTDIFSQLKAKTPMLLMRHTLKIYDIMREGL
jgi:hypothetical protein